MAEKMRKEEEKIKEMAKAMENEEREQAKAAAQSGDTKQSVVLLVCICCTTYAHTALSIRLRSCGRLSTHQRR